jgi:hypothetical protein
MGHWRSVVLGAALVGAGFLAARVIPGRASASRAPESDDLREELANVHAALEELRQAVARGGGTRTVLVPAQTQPVVQAPCAPSATPKDEEAARREQRNHPSWQDAELLVATAIDRGRWTEADVERFREIARQAPPELDLVPLMQRVDAAINSQRLRPDPGMREFH